MVAPTTPFDDETLERIGAALDAATKTANDANATRAAKARARPAMKLRFSVAQDAAIRLAYARARKTAQRSGKRLTLTAFVWALFESAAGRDRATIRAPGRAFSVSEAMRSP